MQKSKRVVKISASSLIEEGVMNSDHFVLSIILSTFYNSVHIYALINNRASVIVFIDVDFAKLHHLELHSLKHQYKLNVVDEHSIDSGTVTHHTVSTMRMSNHSEDISMFVTKLGHYSVILGIKWL